MNLDFEDNQPLPILAYADGPVLDGDIPVELTAVFLSLLKDQSKLRLAIPERETWTVALAGVRAPLLQFIECAQAMGKTK